MVRLVVSLVILVIVLIIRGIAWIVQQASKPSAPPPHAGYGGPPPGGFHQGPHPGQGWPQQQQQHGWQQQQQQQQGWPQQQVTPAVRVLARPDVSFERISSYMAQAGLFAGAPPGPPLQPGEPSTALWHNNGARVAYVFDPRTRLRSLEISGPAAEQVRQALLGVAQMPAVDGQLAVQLLASQNPADQLLGLLAVETLGTGQDARYYVNHVGPLAAHPNPEIASTAQRVQQVLQGRLAYGR